MVLLISSGFMYIVARLNYLLFHVIAEGFAIVVASLIYVLAIRTYKYSKNYILMFLGKTYFYVAVLDFFHMLTYKGMGIFPGYGPDVPTQLWIAGRFLEGLAFVAMLYIRKEHVNRRVLTLVYTIVCTGTILSIMVFGVFPTCYVDGEGLTSFKIISEYIISTAILFSAYILYKRKISTGNETYRIVVLSMVLTAASELLFTLYTDVYGLFNMLGHLVKIASYYVIFAGILVQGIDEPYSLISRELKDQATKDALTNLCNRQGMTDLLEGELALALQNKRGLGILMIDLDNFKQINDNYGHMFGDYTLKTFAGLLNNNIRENDIACRFGGDEFIVLMRDVDGGSLAHVKERIQRATKAWTSRDEKLKNLDVSIGSSLLKAGGTPKEVDILLKEADKSMYQIKLGKKAPTSTPRGLVLE